MRDLQKSKRPLRADAVRNQKLILEAALEIFRSDGLDVPLEDIARRAGVGIGTFYRRFPDRMSLLTEVFETEIAEVVILAETALSSQDPWDSFVILLRSMLMRVANDKGLRQALLSSRYNITAASSGRDKLVRLLDVVIERAQRSGKLRKGVTSQDVPALMLMVGVVADFGSKTSPKLWERYFALIIDGLACQPNQHTLSPVSLSEDQLIIAMSSW